MTCDEVRELLPDHILGTLSEQQSAAVRRHLRGCGGCRADAARLDEGIALFSSAAHEEPPPPDLKPRVVGVLEQECVEAERERARPLAWSRLAVAALSVALVGAIAWAAVAQTQANQNAADAEGYRHFLQALGGKDVRVGTLRPRPAQSFQGTAVLYDSVRGQSWVLVLAHAPGYRGEFDVEVASADGRVIRLPFPLRIQKNGEGSAWLVTSSDISRYATVRVRAADGSVVAAGVVRG